MRACVSEREAGGNPVDMMMVAMDGWMRRSHIMKHDRMQLYINGPNLAAQGYTTLWNVGKFRVYCVQPSDSGME